MKVKKMELARITDKLKSIVQKNDAHPALGGILVQEGYLTAANAEMTMKVKLEGSEDESFIIPAKAFDLIKNLPEGDVEVSADNKNVVTIRMEKIKNSYQSFPAEDFMYAKDEITGENPIRLPGKELMEALGHVLYAAADGNANKVMTGINFELSDGVLNLTGLDGHVVAWDTVKVEGDTPINIIVPKNTVKKLVGMGIIDDIELYMDKSSAVFKTDEYMIYTRLIEGEYFQFKRLFQDTSICTAVDRKELIGAMNRAKSCTDEQSPTKFELSGSELKMSITDKNTNYSETIPLQMEMEKDLCIGFNSKLVLETIKAFTCDNITLNFNTSVMPMLVEAEDSDMKALVLPVKLKGGK